jgi:hypothetical protein
VATMVATKTTWEPTTDDIILDANEDTHPAIQPGTYDDLAAYRSAMSAPKFAALRDAYLRRSGS